MIDFRPMGQINRRLYFRVWLDGDEDRGDVWFSQQAGQYVFNDDVGRIHDADELRAIAAKLDELNNPGTGS